MTEQQHAFNGAYNRALEYATRWGDGSGVTAGEAMADLLCEARDAYDYGGDNDYALALIGIAQHMALELRALRMKHDMHKVAEYSRGAVVFRTAGNPDLGIEPFEIRSPE